MLKYLNTAFYPLFIIALLTLTGCQREIDTPLNNGNNGNNQGETVRAGIRGVVIDENNQPVAGATVTSGSNTTTTDRYGVFQFNNITLLKANGTVKVVKAGYFNGNKSFYTTAGITHNLRIRLQSKTINGSFSATTSGTVTLSTGAKLVIPANSVTDASGNPYNGIVNISMAWIDPSSPNLPELVQGDLRGLTTSGEERGLETYGMIGVEMTGAGNTFLKMATGKTAELSFPIPSSMAGTAPSTIDLWHFDEATGRWKQEGSATKTGSMYIANVSHFSFWNCDAPFPLINLCMTLINSAHNTPLNNVQVRIKRANGSYGYGWTDSSGNLCGMVPKNEPLILQVMDQCHNVVYTQNIGPFSSNTNLGNIMVSIPPVNSLTITGTVTNCTGGNITNGAAIIYTNGAHQYVVPVTNGTFSFTVINCNGLLNFTVMGVDYSNMQSGAAISGSGNSGTVNIGTVQACGTSAVQFAQYIIDGNIYTFVNPPDMFYVNDSTGAPAPYSQRTTFVATQGSQGTNTGFALLTFSNSGATGTLPITSGRIQYPPSIQTMQFVNPNPVVNITAFGSSPGGYIEGNFTEPMLFGATPKNVICTFRVRRN